MKFRAAVKVLIPALMLGALFHACRDGGGPTGPKNPDPSDTSAVPIDTSQTPVARNCVENPVVFTHPLIDPAALKLVTPIGEVGGGNTEIVGRSYLFPKDDREGLRLALIAPADLEVVSAGHYAPPGAPVESGYRPDWVLLIELGCGLRVELYHVKDVHDSIKAAMFDTAVTSSSGYLQLRRKVRFKAGDTLGAYIRGLNSGAFDFIVRSDSVTHRFPAPGRYSGGNLVHVVCPYDLFTGATKAAYYALLGPASGAPVPGAECGTVERDKPGTPAGQWFLDSAYTPGSLFDNRMEGHYGNPMPIVLGSDSTVTIGHTGPTGYLRVHRDNASWKDPESITDGWCYQFPGAWLWLQMNGPHKMRAAYGDSGTCPIGFPSTEFKNYYR